MLLDLLFAHVLHVKLPAHPAHACNLQGLYNVNRGALAVNDLWNGGDWQQFKLDWALLADWWDNEPV